MTNNETSSCSRWPGGRSSPSRFSTSSLAAASRQAHQDDAPIEVSRGGVHVATRSQLGHPARHRLTARAQMLGDRHHRLTTVLDQLEHMDVAHSEIAESARRQPSLQCGLESPRGPAAAGEVARAPRAPPPSPISTLRMGSRCARWAGCRRCRLIHGSLPPASDRRSDCAQLPVMGTLDVPTRSPTELKATVGLSEIHNMVDEFLNRVVRLGEGHSAVAVGHVLRVRRDPPGSRPGVTRRDGGERVAGCERVGGTGHRLNR